MTTKTFDDYLKQFKSDPKLCGHFGTLRNLQKWLLDVYSLCESKQYRYETKDLPSPLDEYMGFVRRDVRNLGKVPYDLFDEIDNDMACANAMVEKFGADTDVSSIGSK